MSYAVKVVTPRGEIMWLYRGHLVDFEQRRRFAYPGEAERAAMKFAAKYPISKSVKVVEIK